ncbi:spore coat protein U domain-containing protein [Sphingomonas panacisoli]|uniref:Spore coat protein U domain-containing protein n=1 Tax=Sphingomonas panacisoli TaxID=1813879 RepID=A0A5B8LJ75_9SPHN|nr:spore coat protein U domain-containing protein [Sphingomonas panacisoli]QDZ08268.1 spore coat protein U domain-containing protein [Sphingomonas panacisoli]
MRMILRALLVLAGLALSTEAQALCSLQPTTTTTFTAASSYDVRTAGAIATVTAPTSLNCNGSLISIATVNTAKATVLSTNGFKLKNAAGDAISYRLSADSAGSYTFTQGGTIDYFSGSLVSLLGILNGANFVPTMYAATIDTPNVPAGTYTDTVRVSWSWTICHGLGIGNVCVLSETGSGTTDMTIKITVGNDCRISAPPLSFGTAPLASQFGSVTQAVAVDCTKDATYTVAFTSGNSGASRPWRAMSDGAGNILQYNIYRTDGTTIWDMTNPMTSAVKGTGSTNPAQMQTYVAKVNPSQTTPPVGHYTDTVSVVIAF